MDNILSAYVLYLTLFNKKLFDNTEQIIATLPKDAFGVFTTIRRHQTILQWPNDIHGCIGYWGDSRNIIPKKVLFNKLLSVSYDAMWSDTRRTYFSPIESDPESFIELDFMMKPIYSIDKKTGLIIELNIAFENDTYGIIIQSTTNDSHKATFLPKVFNDIKWLDILSLIKQKAHITTDDFVVRAYKIKQIKTQLLTLLTNGVFTYINIYKFCRLLIDNVKHDLQYPFIYAQRNNLFEWDEFDDVRNIAVLGDLIKYSVLYSTIFKKDEVEFIKSKIFVILNSLKVSSQALSFLGHIYELYPSLNKDPYCKKLLKDLIIAEEEFEKPEIIIGLSKAKCSVDIDINSFIKNIKVDDSIFKINWTIQVIYNINRPDILIPDILYIFEEAIKNVVINIKTYETNYIGVAFEATCFLYKLKKTKININYMFELFFELEKRKNNYGLYCFLDKSARIDITTHIMNGLFNLK